MNRFLSPLCLALAIATFVAGFALLFSGRPEPSMELHRARVAGDEQYTQLLESRLESDQRSRDLLIVGCFVAGAVLIGAAFFSMRPAEVSQR